MTSLPEIPSFEISQYGPKKSKYAVVIHVINEGEKIRSQLLKMKSIASQYDIVIADGGSSDGSLDDIFLRKNLVTAKLTKTGPGKLSAQMRMSFSYCLQQGYEGIVLIDGNNKDDPAQIPQFIAKLELGYDHIQGSRFIKGGYHRNTPLLRLLGIRLIHAPLISLAAGYHYTDTTNGFRAYSKKLLLNPNVRPFRNIFSNYELHYYLAIRAAQLKLKVTEIPVSRIYPEEGKVPTKIKGIRGNLLVLLTLFRATTGKFDPEDSV
jgi:glycosyltransferase involved in cell wall biosynthesis